MKRALLTLFTLITLLSVFSGCADSSSEVDVTAADTTENRETAELKIITEEVPGTEKAEYQIAYKIRP